MRIMKKLLLASVMTLMGSALFACSNGNEVPSTGNTDAIESESNSESNSETNGGGENLPDVPVDNSFDYYPHSKLNSEKKIYLLNSSALGEELDNDELFTLQAIQGLFARKEVTFYLNAGYVTDGVNTDEYYLDMEAKAHNLTVENITFNETIEMYKNAFKENIADGTWGSKMALKEFNMHKAGKAYDEASGGYDTPGYIVYKAGTISVNVAATLAGLTGFLPIEEKMQDRANELGLVKKFNVSSVKFNYKWIFETALNEINPDGLVHQIYRSEGNVTNPYLKDYGIQNKYMYVYYDSNLYAPEKFKRALHEFLTPNKPIFGYANSEDSDVLFFSQYGQFLIPTDYTCNLSFFSAKEIDDTNKYVQKNNDRNEKAVDGKHYVAFVVSDGDNATYWQNTQTFSSNYMAADGRENDDFKVTWSISPSLADLMPSIMDNAYNNVATKNDYFCAPVSGQGYINAGGFESQSDGKYFKDFCNKLDVYMDKADQQTVTIIGGNSHNDLNTVLDGYAGCKSVKGGIVLDGHKYFGNVPGRVQWVNGKPFVGPRDSLWETTPAYIAARINMYEKNIHSPEGYSIINVHPWSHSYEDIRTICNMLNDDVEVVSVDRLLNMMTENITDKSTQGTKQNGMTITERQLQQNPSLIPVNPLFNDFLLWQEDWTGTGVEFANGDNAMSNVGAIYAGSLRIKPNSKAVKNTFKLPNVDNLWVSFSARAESNNPLSTAKFKMTIKVAGEERVVINEATLKGVNGMNTDQISGDGWQKFAFPLSQYFNAPKNKDCEITIETLDGEAIKLDQFKITARGLKTSFTGDPYNNEFDNKDTEDWFLGEQYKTSQYFFWGAFDHETLKPSGSIQIDCSDGGGNDKRNGNTNIWTAKEYVLPEAGSISFEFGLEGTKDSGAMVKISLYVDGQYIVLHEWTRQLGTKNYTVSLSELAPGLNLNGKKATVVLEARDSGMNNGSGECVDFTYFRTVTK